MLDMSEKGQTSIEYLLILVVAVGLGVTFFTKMSDYFSRNPNSFISKSLNNYKTILGKPQDRYKRFSVVK